MVKPYRNNIACRIDKNTLFRIFLLLGAGLMSSCMGKTPEPAPTEQQSVAPEFRAMYDYLGGEEYLRDAISPLITEGETLVQYTEVAKMVFDQAKGVKNKFRLAPLGIELGFVEPPLNPSSPSGETECQGHSVAPMFLELYEKLGREFVGCPITELHFNLTRNRYEQYFENLGFYHINGVEGVHVLDLGWMACGEICPPEPVTPVDAIVEFRYPIHPLFKDFVDRLGIDLTGFALSEADLASDGRFEQIVENVVLVADSPNSIKSVSLRPLSEEFHLPKDEPKKASGNPGVYFYPTEGELGYEIPTVFWEFILKHGGIALTGAPITQTDSSGSMFAQCFENLCLKYNKDLTSVGRVSLEPLGYVYKAMFKQEEIPQKTEEIPAPTPKQLLSMRVWMSMSSIRSDQQQEVGVSVYENGTPKPDVKPILIMPMPDGSKLNYVLPATGTDGKTGVSLPPIPAANGTLINFDVCLEAVSNELFCVGQSFVIWGNP
jgi:hypothetical protein